MPNILDVAKRAGVAPTTAKRAIHEPHLLKPETLERVRQAIQELGYEPDQVAGGLRRGRTQTIGLMVGNIMEPFFALLVRTVAHAVQSRGYALIVTDNEYDSKLELANLRVLYGHRVSGLIIRSGYGESNLDYLKRMRERGTYVLEIDYFYPDSPFGHVMLDNEGSVFEGVRYLHALGHRRIATLGSYDPIYHPEERSRAFPKALQAVGLPLIEDYQRVILLTEPEAYRLTLELMRLPTPPTAIFSLNGTEAAGAFRALGELGLRIPQDVSLLTFDNYSWTSLVTPPLDVIEQPVEEMGRTAVEIVLEAVEHQTLDKVVRRRFPGKLIRRGSCGPPKDSS
ncbi:MAG TPA: LacI family DNA-binding transcriptional regulator [Meiothermus sp.]|nr:LacI family DNA-binding transcriptional regulator [Meiothermus sp.]